MECRKNIDMIYEERNLRFWGHNCFSVENDESVLLIDPWFSDKGAFFGSWFQYPKNHYFKEEVLNLLKEKTHAFIFVTHEHQDHYDRDFLSLIPENYTLLIPNYSDKRFRDEILIFSKNIIELSDSKLEILHKDLQVKLMISDIGVNHDSAILVSTNDFTFFNQNDCKIFDRLCEIDQDIDFYSVQYSGASRHPPSHLMSPRRKERISHQKTLTKFESVVNGIKELNPKYYLPAAGPPIFPFLDEALSYGQGNIFIHQDFLVDYLRQNKIENVVCLSPGSHFSNLHTDPILPPSKSDIKEYKKNIIDVWEEKVDNNFNRTTLEKVIKERLKEIIDIKIEKSPILIFNFSNKFDDNDFSNKNKIFINLSHKEILDEFNYQHDYYEIIAEEKYFNLMCIEKWQNIGLSLREKIVKRPDVFNNGMDIFLFSDLSDLKENLLRTINISKQRIAVKNGNGDEFEINRFCPHQGADLCNAKIASDNILICPRHGWKFDLNNNGLNKSSGETINSEKK